MQNKFKELDLDNVMMEFDATNLYHSAMWDENSVIPKIETGFAFKPHMNELYVETFNNQNSNQDGKASAKLKTKYYKTSNLIFQHLPIEGKVKNIEVNRKRKTYIVDVLTSVDNQESLKNGGKVIQIYEGVIYRENLKISPFGKGIEKSLL